MLTCYRYIELNPVRAAMVAAIAAGLTVYHDNLKGTFFVLSLIFLMSGIEAFIAIHVESDDVIVVTNMTLYTLLFAALITRGVSAVRRAREKKQEIIPGQPSKSATFASPRRVIIFYAGLGVFFWLIMCFSGSFYTHNRPCIRAQNYQEMHAACGGSIWPGVLETVKWPATILKLL